MGKVADERQWLMSAGNGLIFDAQVSHPWDVSTEQAIAIQEQLRSQVILQDRFSSIQRVAGIDVGFHDGGALTRAAVVMLSYPELQFEESAVSLRPTSFPYVPGLLSFRESPATLEALSLLTRLPDLLLCDGQGIAHPRRFGFASHLGLYTGLPAIGVAKSILVGGHNAVGERPGDWEPMIDQGQVVGAVLRTQPGVKPVYVSIGHCISLESAIVWVLSCTRNFRLPEPVRLAHRLASA
jgi:deoxyribonuclease V